MKRSHTNWAILAWACFFIAMILFLIGLLSSCQAQQRLSSWDAVQEVPFQIEVDGVVLPERFNRYDTALKYAIDYADTVQVSSLYILGSKHRVDLEYELPDYTLGSLMIKDLDWQHELLIGVDEWTLRTVAGSIADSVKFQYVGFDSTGIGLQITNMRVPIDGVVRDTISSPFLGIIQVEVEAYLGTDFHEEWYRINTQTLADL